nr:unnamed protein product [Digitaria exilis]
MEEFGSVSSVEENFGVEWMGDRSVKVKYLPLDALLASCPARAAIPRRRRRPSPARQGPALPSSLTVRDTDASVALRRRRDSARLPSLPERPLLPMCAALLGACRLEATAVDR